MANVIETLVNEEDGFEVQIANHVKGYSVVILDTDANKYFPSVKIFPTFDMAMAFAESII